MTTHLGPSKGDLSPALTDLNIGTQHICGDAVPPQYPSDVAPVYDVIIPASFRRTVHRLERKSLQLKHSVSDLLHLYESDRLLRTVDVDRIPYFPPCFQVINRTNYVLTSDLSPLAIYQSLSQDFDTMADFLGMMELMTEDEQEFEDSEFIQNFRQIKINIKSLLCQLSFARSGLVSSVPATVVRLSLDNWCVAEGADDCWRCNRDAMILSMIDKLCFTLRDKYRHIQRHVS